MTLFKKQQDKPKERGSYGIPHGKYRGEIFCYIESDETDHHFLSLPKMLKRSVPHEKFDFGLKHSIIDFIEILPKRVHAVIAAQYHEAK